MLFSCANWVSGSGRVALVFDIEAGFPSPPDLVIVSGFVPIQWINLKSEWKPFQIVPTPAKFTAYNGEKTLSSFEWWNHWPVAQIDSSGRPPLAPDRASHTSLSHIYWGSSEATVTSLLMDGLTLKPVAQLAALAKSWIRPAAVSSKGLQSTGYQAAERAYLFHCEPGSATAEITLHATADSPVVNPGLIVRDWNGSARVLVNGKPVTRIGQVNRLDGSDLVAWIELELEPAQPVRIEIARP